MTDDQLLDVLTSWQFHGAVKVMARVEPTELRRLVGFVGERLTTIPNPGAYLRRCLDSSAPAVPVAPSGVQPDGAAAPAAAPAPAQVSAPDQMPRASAAQRPTGPDPRAGSGAAAAARHAAAPPTAGRLLPSLTDDQLLTLRAALTDEQRAAFTDGPGRMWKLDAAWSNLPSGRMSRSRLVAELERAGLLAHLDQDAS